MASTPVDDGKRPLDSVAQQTKTIKDALQRYSGVLTPAQLAELAMRRDETPMPSLIEERAAKRKLDAELNTLRALLRQTEMRWLTAPPRVQALISRTQGRWEEYAKIAARRHAFSRRRHALSLLTKR